MLTKMMTAIADLVAPLPAKPVSAMTLPEIEAELESLEDSAESSGAALERYNQLFSELERRGLL